MKRIMFVALIALSPSFATAESAREMIEKQLGAQFVSLAECYAGAAQMRASLAAAEKERDELKARLSALEGQKEKQQ